MTDIQIIARQAAANTFPPDFRDITEADLDHAADAVAMAVGKEWARYAQHEDTCESRTLPHSRDWETGGKCSCGLDDLLSALKEQP